MALKKDIEYKGIILNYHKVHSVNFIDGEVPKIAVSSYPTQEIRDDSLKNFHNLKYLNLDKLSEELKNQIAALIYAELKKPILVEKVTVENGEVIKEEININPYTDAEDC